MGVDAWSDLDDLIVTRAARLVGARDALLWLADDEGELVVRRGLGRFSAAVGRRLGEEAMEADLCVPLAAGGSVVGLLGVAWSDPGRVAGQAESELLGGWAELAAVMVDRARRADAAGPGGRAREQGWLPGDVERYRVLSEQIPAVLYSEVHTPGGAVVYESPQYQKLFGYTPEEATQPDFWKSLVHPDDREWVLAENERVDRTGDPWNVEYRVLTKDGEVMWLRDQAVLVRGQPGEPDWWQGYYIDITEQKQAEEALERERQALERERRAARELRALDDMKNTFLDAVSHELRTPLATVIGIALTLQRAGSSLPAADTADLVDRLVANAGRHTTLDTPVWVRVARRDDGVLLAVEDAGGGASFQVLLPDPARPAG